MAAKKAPGRNVEEWERGTVRVRIPRKLHERAELLAAHRGVEVAAVIEEAVRTHVEAWKRIAGVGE